jgi:hypothetical protein
MGNDLVPDEHVQRLNDLYLFTNDLNLKMLREWGMF